MGTTTKRLSNQWHRMRKTPTVVDVIDPKTTATRVPKGQSGGCAALWS